MGYDSYDREHVLIQNDSASTPYMSIFENAGGNVILSGGIGYHGSKLVITGSKQIKIIDTSGSFARKITL